jgi:hypothetical protein
MRNCETIGIPSMFRSRVMGVGTPVARLDDGTEITFYPAGKKYQFQSRPTEVVWENGVPKIVEGQPVGVAVMYDLQVTVKNYSPGSGVVTYSTWGRALYPGFGSDWKTVPESQFLAMYPEWAEVKAKRFGVSAPVPAPAPAPAPAPTPSAKPTGSALPLLLGAAYLLLS